MPSTVFIVDDEKNIRRTVRMVLEGEGYAVEEASSGEEALARIAEIGADVMLLDVQLPGMSGLETIERIAKLKNLDSPPTIIMISGHATLEDAVRATKAGAFDLIEKPLDRDRVMVTVRNALERRAMGREVQGLRAMTDERFEMVGKSAPMAALFAQIAKVAPTRTRVLITGETGTGKELIARAIHRASALRRQAVRQGQLRRDPARADRVRAVRARARRVHRRDRAQARPVRARRRRHDLPRRDRRHDRLGAGQGAARAADGRVHARRRRAGAEGRRARRRRDQPRPAGGGRGERVPRGSVLPAQRRAAARAAAARARRRTSRCCRGRSSSSPAARTA